MLWTMLLAVASASVPVQGALSDVDGAPLHGPRTVEFRLYEAGSGGTPAHLESLTIQFEHGAFAAALGSSLAATWFRDHPNLWLSVTHAGVESDRVAVGRAPFAAFADYAGDAATLGGVAAAGYWKKSEPIRWTDVDQASFPAWMRDGYTAGSGLTLTGTTLSAPAWTAGSGLTLTGRTFSAATFAAGAGLTLDGTTFAAIPYTAGAGLTLTGRTFSLDPAVFDSASDVTTALAAQGLTLSGSNATIAGSLSASGFSAGTAAPTCDTANRGRVWLDTTRGSFYACDGVGWSVTVPGLGATCANNGAAAATAGSSCKALLDCGVRSDGPRWLDPDGTGANPAFLAYCDMTSDGGPSWA